VNVLNRRERRLKARAEGKTFKQVPGSNRPFKRERALLAAMKAIVDKGLEPVDREAELALLPPYHSRGHGGRHRTKNRSGTRALRDRSKYDPAQEDLKHAEAASRRHFSARVKNIITGGWRG
jgi:hypothetical protein